MASEGEDRGAGPEHDGARRHWRRLAGGAGTAAPPASVRLIREFKATTVADQERQAAAALPGRVSVIGGEPPRHAAGGLFAGPGARRRAVRRRWMLAGGALALVVAAVLAVWLASLAGT
jgi:hypothetical protein